MTSPPRRPAGTGSSRRVVQAARLVRATKRAWDGRLPPPGERPTASPARERPTAAPAPARSARQVPRVGRIAARVAWALATVGLLAVGVLDIGSAARAVLELPGHGGGPGTVAGTVLIALLLVLAGGGALACAPSCAPRVVGRRRRPGRSRFPRALIAAEVTARIVAGGCLLGAALEAHESTHLWFARGGATAALLARIAVHPITLIAAGVAAAAVSRRWSRLAHAARTSISPGDATGRRGRLSRRDPRSAGRST